MKTSLTRLSLLMTATAIGLATSARGQLRWDAYDTSGNLVTANVASGGDVISGSSVNFTIPATTRMFFVTKSFKPITLTAANSALVVDFKFSASAGLTGVAQRTIAWGLYNSSGTATLADDIGYFGGWYGPSSYVEGLYHASGSGDLFSGTSPGLGKTTTGTPADGVIYTNQIRLFLKTAPIGVALGSSSSTLGAAGVAMNGPGLVARGYTNPANGTNSFDEFAVMFYNTTANPVTITLSAIGLGDTVTWDASAANPAAPTDGSGLWSSTNANWSGGAGGAIAASDNVWLPGYSAVIGANNGAAGTITIDTNSAGVTVSNLTFNAAGSGSYAINGNAMILQGSPTITVASGVIATNAAPLGGTGFTKAGNGLLVLAPTVGATNVGVTKVNAGTLYLAGGSVNSLNDDVVVNAGATLQVSSSLGINPASTLTINGGAVTNMGVGGTSTETHNLVVFDNNGILAYGPTGSGQLVGTNYDFRSGLEAFPKFAAGQATNFSVKSTSGTMAVQSRPNNTGVQGIILTMLGGTMILDYPNPAPNGDATQGGAKFLPTGPLTLGGGTLFGRFDAAASRTETVKSLILWPGATSFWLTNNAANGSGSYSVVQNAISRSVGGTVNYRTGGTSSGTKTITTTTVNANGILGGWATWAESDWAVGSASGSATAISGYSAYTTSSDPTTWAAANNVSLSASPSPNVADATAINSLKLSGNLTVTLNGTLTLNSGGLLISGSAAPTITGGTLKGGSGTDLIVEQHSSGNLTIASALADNGGASALTKSGKGKLVLTGANGMTGNNYLNGGTVEVSDLAKLASGSLVMNDGTLAYTGSDATSSRSVVLAGVGGTFDIQAGTKVTQSASVVSAGGATSTPINGVSLNLGDWSGLTKAGAGTLVLDANNVYNGPTVVSNGVLIINGINSLTGTSGSTNYSGGGTFTIYAGTLGGSGVIPGATTIKNGGTIAPGSSIGTLTLSSSLTLESGSTSLFEVTNGAINDVLVVQGDLNIASGSTLAISVLGTMLEPTTNVVITYSGHKTGSFNPTVALAGGSLNASVSIDESTPGQIKLIAVPQVVITSQPESQIVSTNDPVTFCVGATGSAPLGYQWYYSSSILVPATPISGANSACYNIASADGTDNGVYSVVVTNNYNSVTSMIASLTVGNVCSQLEGPSDQTVIQGGDVTFSTTVILGNPAPTLQWQTNNIDVVGATGTSLTLNNVQYDVLNNATISVIASNAACMTTNTATLTVIVPPVITPQFTDITVNAGDTASFVSGATGHPTPSLQWYKKGVALGGETGSTLTINNAQGSDIGTYSLVASNAAGATTNSAKLVVNSTTLAQTTLAPANSATGVCYDTPLYLTFNGPISIVNSGKIRIYNVSNPGTPVDTIDMSSNTVVVSTLTTGVYLTNNFQPHSLFSGDSQVINYFPVIITGNTAAIYPHSGVMTSNQTYYVTMDNGIVADSDGAYFAGISSPSTWQFTTKPTGPANPTNMVVAADGSGDFATVQGAVDSVTPGNTTYTLINIRDGNYVEIVNISGKHNLTLRGQSRSGTVVGYGNNNNITGTTAARMAFKVNSSDIKLENLTIINTTPQGGSQAEALLVYNNGLRCIVNHCDIRSRQDTILINQNTSQAYFYYSEIYGNFDYVWGVGVGYFDHCSFHTITNQYSSSYNLTAARTATSTSLSATTPWINPNGTTYSAYGFTFVDCTMQADPSVTGITLAGSNGTAGGLDSWVNCLIDTNAYVTPTSTLSNTYVFWQNGNKDITGTYAISFANVQTIGVTNNDPRLIASTNATIWFSGWTPTMAPNILTNPSSQTVSAGDSATFVVSATGIPAPTYQWLKDGTPIGGATSDTLMIPLVHLADAADYSVVVSNIAGSVTSAAATLTVTPHVNTAAPVFTAPANGSSFAYNVGAYVSVTNTATDADMPAETITFSLLSGSGSITADGIYTWRPEVSDADTTNVVTVVVTDDGAPNMSATNSFSVIVNPLTPWGIISSTYDNGQFGLTIDGLAGPDYAVQVTTNLAAPVWVTLFTTNSPALPFTFLDPNAGAVPMQFYRVVVGPPLP